MNKIEVNNIELQKVVFDTSALMSNNIILDKFIDLYEIVIPIIVVQELDGLKTSDNKEKAFCARQVIKQIKKYLPNITFDDCCSEIYTTMKNDDIIVDVAEIQSAYLVTDDLAMKIKAKAKDITVIEINNEEHIYQGYKEVIPNDQELSNLYANMEINHFDCITNQYVLIKNEENEVVDRLKWNGEKYVNLYSKNIKSITFGDKIKPKDDYQRMVVDSIMTNTMTTIVGSQGTGKSLLSLVCAMNLIENKKYDTLVILFNPIKTKGVADLGFYSGDAIDKAKQNAIGNILISKFGDVIALDMMLSASPPKIKLISMADMRGIEITDKEILYITEAQNTSKDLMKLCLGRASQNAKIIIEGDYAAQVDSVAFENKNNGLKRAIEVLKGEDCYGHIELKNVYRSKIAELVEKF